MGLSYNQLTGEIPSDIGNLDNLTYLILYNNQLTGTIPSELGDLTNLINLYLNGNRLIDFYQKNATKDQLEKDPETGQDVLKTKVKKELGFVTNAAGRIIPYFPLVREGSWWIDYVAADGDTYTLSYESKRQAEQAAKEIEQDPTNKIEYKKLWIQKMYIFLVKIP